MQNLTSRPAKVLVTGASGLLGAWVCRELLDQGNEVIALSQHTPLREDLATYRVRLDLCDKDMLDSLFQQFRPTAVIHTAALADPQLCEEQPLLSRRLNVEVSRQIAQRCQINQIPMVFTSTDLVYDGERGNYLESDPVSPINRYGEHKAEAERVILDACPTAAVFRLPLLYGEGLYATSPMHQWLKQLEEGKRLFGFSDELRSSVDYPTAAAGIVKLYLAAQGEVIHLGGIETLSRLILMRSIASAFGYNPQKIEAKVQADMTFRAARPRDVSLDSRKARAMGYKTPILSDVMQRFAKSTDFSDIQHSLRP